MDNETKPSTAARRQFLADTARMAFGVGLLGLGVGLYARHAKALPPAAIRPPGALPETDFSAACIRCGMCVRDCPFDILHLARPEQPLSTGTPYFVARQLPCEMCEDIPCVKACPTGALDHSLIDINKSKMGLAVLVDHETCLNFLGLRCDICYRVCPVIDKAITLDPQTNARTGKHTLFIPVVHSDHCTGCGKCVEICPKAIIHLRPASARIFLACSNHDRGAKVKKYCSVGCNACTLCVKATPSGAVEIKDFLPVMDYTKEENFVAAAFKCPQNCYTDLALKRPKVSIDQKCNGCTECVKVCPVQGAIEGPPNTQHKVVFEKCIGCGRCISVCPVKAINLMGALGYEGKQSRRGR